MEGLYCDKITTFITANAFRNPWSDLLFLENPGWVSQNLHARHMGNLEAERLQ